MSALPTPASTSDTACVAWTIVPDHPPRPWLPCAGCGTRRPFAPTGRVRLNANGRRLDAWLIHACLTCGHTWNRPLLSRAALAQVDAALLHALHTSDPARVRDWSFDLAALRRHTPRVEEADQARITAVAIGCPAGWRYLEIRLFVPHPCAIRLDRILAQGLGCSRGQAVALAGEASGRALRRAVQDGRHVVLDLESRPDRAALCSRASGLSPAP